MLLLQVTLGVEFQLARCHLRPKARTKASYLIESTRLRPEKGHKYLKGGVILSNKCTDSSLKQISYILNAYIYRFCIYPLKCQLCTHIHNSHNHDFCQALVPSPVLLDPKPSPNQSKIKTQVQLGLG